MKISIAHIYIVSLLASTLLWSAPSLRAQEKTTAMADTSKGVLVLVNKTYGLPTKFRPTNLVKLPDKYSTGELMLLQAPAESAFRALVDAARKDGHWIHNRSAFRTEAVQRMLYTQNVRKHGEKAAGFKSALPGHSEHQTGLAVDVNRVHQDFENSASFKWLEQNAHLYGFILRYPKGKEDITGYQYEPWHFRYVGIEAATFIHQNQITFEEYYNTYVLNK